MSTWKGWQSDLLKAAHQPDTSHNRQFLSDWHAASGIDCDHNPVDLTAQLRHSKNCKLYRGPRHGHIHYQAYRHPADAGEAFREQLGSGKYPNLLVAIAQGNPYDTSKITADIADKIETELAYWGSAAFGADYANFIHEGGPPPKLKAPQALKGWGHLQRSVNHELPAALKSSQHAGAATLRAIAHARKVKV